MSDKKRYRVYNVILSDIIDINSDKMFAQYIIENKFEWWRYTPLNWILVTPINVYTNQLIAEVMKAYAGTLFFILEIDILDAGGIQFGNTSFRGTHDTSNVNPNPFLFFEKIKDPQTIFPWEK